MNSSPLDGINEMFLSQQQEIASLRLAVQESVARRILSLDDVGWTSITDLDDSEGLNLNALNHIAERLRDMSSTNPLFIRGAQLRHAYVFGRGLSFANAKGSKAEEGINNNYNRDAMFSVKAFETNNLAIFTDGNLFVTRNEKTNILSVIPMHEITGVVTDPDDNSKVRFFKRTWTSNNREQVRWYPLSRYKKTIVGRGRRNTPLPKTINKSPVDQESVMYHHTGRRMAGWTFGLPDSLGAFVHAVSYSEYLSDNALLVKALSQLAWKVTAASKAGADTAASKVVLPGTGGTAVLGQGNDISAVSRGNDVNFNNGQPLAAMVAASLGVPVIALLSSPGATGGSYGAAQTLDEPTLKGMKAVQDGWKVFYAEIVTDMGAPDVDVAFPNISQDPTYREMSSLAQAYTTGAIFQDEYRQAALNLLDVEKTKEGLPKPDAFNAGADPNDPSNAVPSQGNTGSVKGGVNQDVANHDNDTK